MNREADADGRSPAASASRIMGVFEGGDYLPLKNNHFFRPAMWFTGPKPLPGA